jgi:hypothetical protein
LHCSSPFASTMRLVRITLSYSSQGRMAWRSKSWCPRSLSNTYRCVKIPNPSMYEWYCSLSLEELQLRIWNLRTYMCHGALWVVGHYCEW